jgi:hypothetical protein
MARLVHTEKKEQKGRMGIAAQMQEGEARQKREAEG